MLGGNGCSGGCCSSNGYSSDWAKNRAKQTKISSAPADRTDTSASPWTCVALSTQPATLLKAEITAEVAFDAEAKPIRPAANDSNHARIAAHCQMQTPMTPTATHAYAKRSTKLIG